jgi:hypothetical protein
LIGKRGPLFAMRRSHFLLTLIPKSLIQEIETPELCLDLGPAAAAMLQKRERPSSP